MNERIKQLRVELELTQMQFAEKIGLSRNYIAMIEMGAREPSDRTISDICRVFGVSEAWLRDGTEPMYVQRSENARAGRSRRIHPQARHRRRPRHAPGVLGQHSRIREKNHRKQVKCFR